MPLVRSKNLSKNRAPDTYRWYRDLLQKFIALHADLRVDDIRPFHVQRWVDGYPHLSKTSRRNHMRSVKRCVKWAVTQGYLDQNPLQLFSIPTGERKEVLVTDDEYERVLQFARPDSLRDLFTTTRESGCRPQESLRVEARHVDVANQRWVIPPSEAKGEKMTRIVYLTDKAFEITRCLMRHYPVGRKTDGELRCEAKVKLTNRLATSLVPRYSLYKFRHSFATHALQRGVDSVTVAVLMGHTDPSMLAKVYQHLTQNPAFLLDQAKKARA